MHRLGVIALLLVTGGGVWLGLVEGSRRARRNSPITSSSRTTADLSARFAGYKAAREPNGDVSKVEWPDFVLAAGPEVKRLYEFQVEHGELMRYMPSRVRGFAHLPHRS